MRKLAIIPALAFALAFIAAAGSAQEPEPLRFEITMRGPITINGLEVAPEGTMLVLGLELAAYSTPPPTPPAAISDLAAEAGDGQATLTWSAAAGANDYDLYADSGGGFALLASGVTSPRVQTGLDNGTEYTFFVRANGDGGSTDSNEDSATPADTTAPSAPSAPTLTPGDTEITVTLPSLTGDIVGFRVYTSDAVDGTYVQDTSTPQTGTWDITGLTNGVEVFVKISAEDEAANESALSAASSETPADVTAPDAPNAPTLTPGDTEIEVTLPSLTGDVVGFEVYVSESEVGGYSKDTSTPQTSTWTIDGLTNGVTYHVRITAVDEADNESAQSDASSATPASAGISDPTELATAHYYWNPGVDWTLDTAPTPDEVVSVAELVSGTYNLPGNTARRPEAVADAFGSGLHAVRIARPLDDMQITNGWPSGVDKWAMVMVLKLVGTSNGAHLCGLDNITSNNPAAANNTSFRLYWSAGKLYCATKEGGTTTFYGPTAGSYDNTDGNLILRVEYDRNSGSSDGYFNVLLNGDVVLSGSGKSFSAWGNNYIHFGNYLGATYSGHDLGAWLICTGEGCEADAAAAEEWFADPARFNVSLP